MVVKRTAIRSGIEISSLVECFQDLPDPRVAGRCDHQLIDVIMIAVWGDLWGGELDGGRDVWESQAVWGTAIFGITERDSEPCHLWAGVCQPERRSVSAELHPLGTSRFSSDAWTSGCHRWEDGSAQP